jgi:iron complex transport system ATP-binding protein
MHDANPVLELTGATVVRGNAVILDGVTLTVHRGEHTAILGPNGSGKSTLLKLFTGQLYPLARPGGSPPVRAFGRTRWNLEELRSYLGILSPDLHQRFTGGTGLGRATGLEAVIASFFSSEALFLHHEVSAEMRHRALRALARVGAEHLAERPMDQMSTGETRRVLIARALVHDPCVLVLDEPTTGLDLIAGRDFLERLRKLARDGTTLILVTHHVEEIIPEVRQIVLLSGGKVFARGGPEVLDSRNLSRVFGAGLSLRRKAGRYEVRLRPEHATRSARVSGRGEEG